MPAIERTERRLQEAQAISAQRRVVSVRGFAPQKNGKPAPKFASSLKGRRQRQR